MVTIAELIAERETQLPQLLEQATKMPQIQQAVDAIVGALESGHRLTACGNGGNFANADHLIGEFIGRFRYERGPLAAFPMTGLSAMTAIANDFGFEQMYARQVRSLLQGGDVLVGYSTSGNSANVIEAMRAARQVGATTIGFSGTKGKLKEEVDIAIAVSSEHRPMIEEMHYILTHIICELAEIRLCANDPTAHRKR